MLKILEKFSQNKQWARVLKVLIAITILPAIVLRAIALDLIRRKDNSFYD